MSASEKLRALIDAKVWEDDDVYDVAFIDALPQIVAVVEAAERAAYEATQGRVPDRARPILRREVAPALTALEQVLTNPQGKD